MANRLLSAARSLPMSDETRGHAIRARRLAHGIKSVSALAKASGVSRDAVTAAEDGTASTATYERLEAWLDRFEEESGADEPEDPHTVTFTVEGLYGAAKVVVSGPVENADALRRQVEALLRGNHSES